jgi:peptidoglycan/LPS O-acetylase OafA/YrhL
MTTTQILQRNLGLREIPSLTGLRGLAALTVVCHHVFSTLFPGQSAVVLFFVLSGFLITWLLETEIEQSGKLKLLSFYTRRARRLLPAFYVWWVISMAIAIGIFHFIPVNLVAAGLFVSDFFQARHLDGMFYEISWSLSIEEQFYLLWPLVLIAFRNRKRLQLTIWFTVVLIQVTRLVFGYTHSVYIYNSFHTRADALLVGCSTALWLKSKPSLPPWVFARFAWLIPIAAFVASLSKNDHLITAIGLTVAAYASVLLIIQMAASAPKFLNSPFVRFLGKISYSLYLYHLLVLMCLDLHNKTVSFFWRDVLAVPLSIAVASASYWLIERPFFYGTPVPVTEPMEAGPVAARFATP